MENEYNKKIKILHVAQAAGGVDRYLRTLLKYLDKDKFENIVVLSQDFKKEDYKDIADTFISIKMERAIGKQDIPNTGLLTTYSNSMDGIAEVSLCFEYNEIKHIIIPTLDEYRQLVENIDLWKLGDEKYDILSKIIVWEQSRGDF